ncbi:MAG TPA: biotin transporter BioY, partial [Oscillospiraceae bacterium]|nr:biotin transporter BioY [Oscillospiraceae bacterium]
MKTKTEDVILAGLFSALICVGAFIRMPLLLVPMTLQFFFVNLAVLFQERPYGILSVLAYLLLGLGGLPVFAGGGGISYLLNPTFGYLIGFLLAAAVSGYLKNRLAHTASGCILLSMLNIFLIHLCGVSYFYCLSNFYLGNPISFTKLLVVGSLIFLPNDILSGVLSSFFAVKMRRLRNIRRMA